MPTHHTRQGITARCPAVSLFAFFIGTLMLAPSAAYAQQVGYIVLLPTAGERVQVFLNGEDQGIHGSAERTISLAPGSYLFEARLEGVIAHVEPISLNRDQIVQVSLGRDPMVRLDRGPTPGEPITRGRVMIQHLDPVSVDIRHNGRQVAQTPGLLNLPTGDVVVTVGTTRVCLNISAGQMGRVLVRGGQVQDMDGVRPCRTGTDTAGEPSRPPELQNPARVASMLQRVYPALLRDARVSGTVHLWCRVSHEGAVERFVVSRSSGFEAFDAAAISVAIALRFSPALDRGIPVATWVEVPLVFEVSR
jgi:TonB family protein